MDVTRLVTSPLVQHHRATDPKPASITNPGERQETARIDQPVRLEQKQAVEKGPEVELSAVVENLNDHVQNVRRSLQVSVDEQTGRPITTVFDAETEQVIRRIAPQEIIALVQRFRQQRGERTDAEGILFQEKA